MTFFYPAPRHGKLSLSPIVFLGSIMQLCLFFFSLLQGLKLSPYRITLLHNQPWSNCRLQWLYYIQLFFRWFHWHLIVCVLHRQGLWDNLLAIEILHQSAGELRHLQAHRGERALAALPVLQRLLWEDLPEGRQGLHPPRRWRAERFVHGRVQRHLPAQRRKRGFLHPGGTTQRVQLWPERGVTGEAAFSHAPLHPLILQKQLIHNRSYKLKIQFVFECVSVWQCYVACKGIVLINHWTKGLISSQTLIAHYFTAV